MTTATPGPTPVPLGIIVQRLSARLGPDYQRIIGMTLARVTSPVALDQYVEGRGLESYQTKGEHQLALEVAEELADAVAYIAPLAEINPRYAEAAKHIARAYDLIEHLSSHG